MRETIPNPQANDVQTVIRSDNRHLSAYQKFFGSEIGKGNELILDMGAGDSHFAQEIQDSQEHNARVIRLDADYANNPPADSRDTVAASATQLPFNDNTFDKVVSSWMMLHIPRAVGQEALKETLRVTKPGGQILMTPALPRLRKGKDTTRASFKKFNKIGLPQTLAITKPNDFDSLSEAERAEIVADLAESVTMSPKFYNISRYIMAKAVSRTNTNQLTFRDVKKIFKGRKDNT
jgi:ubiquinone/menaquinone biosynthesis C-methylase UbiE